MEIIVFSPGLEGGCALIIADNAIQIVPDVVPDLAYMTEQQEELLKRYVTDDYATFELDGDVCAIMSQKETVDENHTATQLLGLFPWGNDVPNATIRGSVYIVNTVQAWTLDQALNEARRLRQLHKGEARGIEVAFKTSDTQILHWLPIPEGDSIETVFRVEPEDAPRFSALTSQGIMQRFTIGPKNKTGCTFTAQDNVVGQRF